MIEFVLEMLFSTGEYEKGDEMLRSFWGGMVKAGATTFWEMYIEGETMETATEMYARPFGRSYCHIWGAGPLYVVPRFYFGIRAENFGDTFVVEPNLALVKGCSIKVPLKKGELDVAISLEGEVTVCACGSSGRLVLNGKSYSVKNGEKISVK